MTKYKVTGISEMEALGFDLGMLNLLLTGSGKWIVTEFDREIGWYPTIGENRFKSNYLAQLRILERLEMDRAERLEEALEIAKKYLPKDST